VRGGEEMKPKAIVLLIIALLVFVILLQNTQVITVRLLFWTIHTLQQIQIVFTVLIGFVIGYLTSLLMRKGRSDD
jgi:uncharacterized integral membrane protein